MYDHVTSPAEEATLRRITGTTRNLLARLLDACVAVVQTHRSAALRYALGAALAGFSFFLHRELLPFLGEAMPFHFLYPAVMLSAWFGGFGPGVFVTLATALLGALLFPEPYFSLAPDHPNGLARVVAFIMTGIVVSLLCESLHVARRREALTRRRFENLAEQRVDLDAVAMALAGTIQLPEVAEAILERGRRMLGARAGSLTALEPAGNTLRILYAVGYPPGVADRDATIPMDSPEPMAEAVREGRPVVLESRRVSDSVYPHLASVRERTGTQAVAALPLLVQQRVIGGLGFSFLEARHFDAEDLALLQTLAYQCALAVERAQLYEAERASRLEAQHLNRIKDDFLATLSHELRTPLSAILIWLDLLRTERLDPGALRALQMIDRSAGHLSQLIGELLDVSRIVAGKLTLNRHPLDLPGLVDAVLESVRPAAEAKRIRLDCKTDRSLPPTWADGSRLRQALENLLSNAVKFTLPEGRVAVTLQASGGRARLRVEDTGVGIAPELLPFVFERFRQGDSSSTRSQQGLGLGLTIARRIVELHEGRITAESAGVGRGSLFTIHLPLVKVPPPSSTLPQSAADTPVRPLRGLKVLLVDDHEDTLRGMALALEANGARVTAVGSVGEALVQFDRGRPDVIVSDIAMPERDGHDLIQSIRSRPEGAGGLTPAIALSAYVGVEDRLRALTAGYQDHVPKPVEVARLVYTIARLARPTA